MQRLERVRVADPRQRSGRRHGELAVARARRSGRRRAPIADAAERDRRRLPRFEILGAAAARSANRPRRRRSAPAPRRPAPARRRDRAAGSARAARPRPSSHPRTRAIPRSRSEPTRCTASSRSAASRSALMLRRTSAAMCSPAPYRLSYRSYSPASASAIDLRRRAAAFEQLHQRHGHVLVAQLARAPRPPARAAVRRSSSGTRRGATAGSPSRASAWIAGNARKKSRCSAMPTQRLAPPRPHEAGRALRWHETARWRRDRRGARSARGNRAPVAAFAEDERRLNPQVRRRRPSRQRDERLDDVDVGDRQQIQRAAEHAEVAMLLAQRPHQRVDDRIAVLRQRRDRVRRTRQSSSPSSRVSDSIVALSARVAPARGSVASDDRPRAWRSRSTRAVTSSIVTIDADDPALLTKRTDGDVLLHPVEVADGSEGGQRESGSGAAPAPAPRRCRASSTLCRTAEQAARPRAREARRRAAGSGRCAGGDPVAAASHAIPGRTTSARSVVKMPNGWRQRHAALAPAIARRSVRRRRPLSGRGAACGSRAAVPRHAAASERPARARSRSSVPPRVCLTPLALRSVICADLRDRGQRAPSAAGRVFAVGAA